jgi:hypothetical protein
MHDGPDRAAIANALYDALGVRVRDLPLTRRTAAITRPELVTGDKCQLLKGNAVTGSTRRF